MHKKIFYCLRDFPDGLTKFTTDLELGGRTPPPKPPLFTALDAKVSGFITGLCVLRMQANLARNEIIVCHRFRLFHTFDMER